MTDVLFKYRSMANDQEVRHTLAILDNRKLFCPAPSSFNDPFECRSRLSFDAPTEIKHARAKEWLLGHDSELTEDQAAELAPSRWKKMEEGTDEFYEYLRHGIGIASFGGTPADILMWSYYASSHTGICLEFRASREEHAAFFGLAQEVHYQQELPTVNFYTATVPERLRAYVLTKAERWRHEAEWRIIIDAEREGRFVPIPPGALTAVFLGARISDRNRGLVQQRLVSAARAGEVQVYQARVSPDAYKLTLSQVEPCW